MPFLPYMLQSRSVAIENLLNKGATIINNLEDKEEVKEILGEILSKELKYPITLVFSIEDTFLASPIYAGPPKIIKEGSKAFGLNISDLTYKIDNSNTLGKCVLSRKHKISSSMEEFMVNPPLPGREKIMKAGETLMKLFKIKEFGFFPCIYNEKAYGLFVIGSHHKLKNREIKLLLSISDIFGGIIAFSDLINGVKRQNKILKQLYSTASKIISTDPLSLSENTEKILGYDKKTSLHKIPVIEINFDTGEVHKDGIRLSTILSDTETQILKYMHEHKFKITTKENIAEIIWGKNYHNQYSDWAISQAISRIRKKLGDTKPYKHLFTLKNKGFMFRDK